MPSTTHPALRNRVLLLAWWGVFYASFTLFFPALFDDADSVHAEVAREMLVRHDWVTLYANGIRYLEKAPLLYWSMAASFRVFGVSTAAARVPLALAALGLALAAETFARRAFESARAGLYGGLILLSSFGVFIFTRITIPDVGVCLWLTLALYVFWLTEQTDEPPRRAPCWAFAACCALNVLTKGLIGIVFPVAIVGIYLLLTRGVVGALRRVVALHFVSSCVVFLLIAAPWHVLAGLANPAQGHPGQVALMGGHWYAKGNWRVPDPTDGNVHGWFWFYFVNEHLLRYVGLRTPKDYDTVPLGLFYGLCVAWLAPWSGYVVPAVGRAVRRVWSESLSIRWTHLLLLLWAAIPLLFFSLSTRQEYYVLPALPALMLLLAGWLAAEPPFSRIGYMFSVLMAVVGAVGAAFALYLLAHTHTAPPGTELADLLRQNPADYALSFGHFLDLDIPSMDLFRTPLILTPIALIGGTVGNLLLRRNGRPHAANLALAAGAAVLLVASHSALRTFAPVLSSEQLARVIAPKIRPQDLLVIHGEYEAGSTLAFYLRRNDVHIYEGRSANLWYGSFFADAPKIFETRESIEQRWGDRQRIFLWQDPSDKARPLPQLPGAIYLIAQSGGKQILSNQPDTGPREHSPTDFDEEDDPPLAPIALKLRP